METSRAITKCSTQSSAPRLVWLCLREDGETVANYTYNALGQRTRKELQTETTLFHYDTGIQLLAESDETGQPGREYLWLGARPIAQIESIGLVTYLHTDHLLTPRMGTSDVTNIVWQWEGEAFGDVASRASVRVDLRFPGQYYDAEAMQNYNIFRHYDPSTGRYSGNDPLGIYPGNASASSISNLFPLSTLLSAFGRASGQDVFTQHTYDYAGANPIIWFDRYGLSKECCGLETLDQGCVNNIAIKCAMKSTACAFGFNWCEAVLCIAATAKAGWPGFITCTAFCGGYGVGSTISCFIEQQRCNETAERVCKICL